MRYLIYESGHSGGRSNNRNALGFVRDSKVSIRPATEDEQPGTRNGRAATSKRPTVLLIVMENPV